MVNGYLQAKTEEQFQDENDTICHTAVFPDRKQMDVKCCGAQDGYFWTETVLFDENGYELCCSEISDQYDGVWELEYHGRCYVVIIQICR